MWSLVLPEALVAAQQQREGLFRLPGGAVSFMG